MRGSVTPDRPGLRPPGFRLPDATRLGPVTLAVSDLERSLRYYRDLLGFTVRRDAPGSASLRGAGGQETLIVLTEEPGAARVPRSGLRGLYHVAILLPEREALGRLIRHLAEQGERMGMSDHLVSEAIYLTDPDGLGLEVYADRPRAEWRTSPDNELEMDSRPLDAEALVAAGGAERWQGMPFGTTVGHLHFSVASAEQARDFFHQGLGFDLMVWSYPGAVFLSAGGYHHHVAANTWAARAPQADAGDARLVKWSLVLPDPDDVAALAKNAEAFGAVVMEDPHGVLIRDAAGAAVRILRPVFDS